MDMGEIMCGPGIEMFLDDIEKEEKMKKNVNNNVNNSVSTDEELNEDVMEDFYKYHEKIEIPICFYEDDNGERVYDYEAMAEEFENRLSKIVGVTVMCSVSEDITYE